ncbi:hypothetical protein [Flavobacterium covae]|uniref:hypothetical protein n=1 Tax=Flavobacterium covae TaxID=2906076 RepID=UPI000F4DA817|nr:hypothetical protein [Flavobacterium covae]
MGNIISNNEQYYNGKKKTYNNGLVCERMLIDTFYHKTNSRFANFNFEFKNKAGIEFTPIDNFDNEALEYRSKLLYEIVKNMGNKIK